VVKRPCSDRLKISPFDPSRLRRKPSTLWVANFKGSVMRRREFVTLISGAAATWPLAALAQPAKKIPRIGVLWHAGSAEEEAIYLRALNEGFSNLGYVEN